MQITVQAAQTTTGDMSPPYEIRASLGKGYGVFATRSIPAGTLILSDHHVMVIAKDGGKRRSSEHDIQLAFEGLEQEQVEQFLSLHAGPEDGRTLVERIYTTNRFGKLVETIMLNSTDHSIGDFDSSYLCLTISRLNHACSPNAASYAGETDDVDDIRAIAPIREGEEICISYRYDLCWIMTREQRRAFLEVTNMLLAIKSMC